MKGSYGGKGAGASYSGGSKAPSYSGPVGKYSGPSGKGMPYSVKVTVSVSYEINGLNGISGLDNLLGNAKPLKYDPVRCNYFEDMGKGRAPMRLQYNPKGLASLLTNGQGYGPFRFGDSKHQFSDIALRATPLQNGGSSLYSAMDTDKKSGFCRGCGVPIPTYAKLCNRCSDISKSNKGPLDAVFKGF